MKSIKRLVNAQGNPRIRKFALFFSENNKVTKILRLLKFEGVARSYLEKSDRTLFIQKNNLLYWNKSNPEASEILSIVRLEKRSIAYEVQQVLQANLLMEATKSGVMKIVEIGSYKGGTAVLFRRLLDHFRSGEGEVFAYDTFQGHPHINESIDIHPKHFFEQTGQDTLEYLSDNHVNYVIGDVLETFSFEDNKNQITFLHLDVDLYDVTKKFLNNLSTIIRKNGIVVIDDFGKPSCPGIAQAFLETKEILDEHFVCLAPMSYQLVLIRI